MRAAFFGSGFGGFRLFMQPDGQKIGLGEMGHELIAAENHIQQASGFQIGHEMPRVTDAVPGVPVGIQILTQAGPPDGVQLLHPRSAQSRASFSAPS